MKPGLVEEFMAACGAAEPVRLRIRGARLADPLVREWRQPFVIVGRSPRADLHLDSPEIGNPQAYLQFVAGHLFAVDLQGGARLLAGTGGNAWMGAEAVHFGPYSVEWMAAAPAAAPGRPDAYGRATSCLRGSSYLPATSAAKTFCCHFCWSSSKLLKP